uniref:Uncharacterized protein n=1 Tax=Anguilla anguilla TaxID=7936 RepID=A0A0E9WY44_ANGAN
MSATPGKHLGMGGVVPLSLPVSLPSPAQKWPLSLPPMSHSLTSKTVALTFNYNGIAYSTHKIC